MSQPLTQTQMFAKAEPKAVGLSAWRAWRWPLIVLGVYWLALIHQLGAQWSLYEQYNYGWSVPFLCAYLIWQRLQSSKSEVQSSEFKVQGSKFASPPFSLLRSSFSYPALFLCAVLYALTRFLHEANPVWRLTSLLWTLEVIGLTLLTIRIAFGRPLLAKFAFPVCFFIVAVPWPYPLETFLVES